MATSRTTGNILVVDDTPANLQLLAGMLREHGYTVRPAPSGQLALRAAASDPPDLILLDINMPDMNGYEVCEQLKKDERTRDIPIIFISALNEMDHKILAFTSGGVDYITKPFQIEEVHARVNTQLAAKHAHDQLRAANRKMKNELDAAAKVQQAVLPQAKPDINGVSVSWICAPCDELGGDALSFFTVGDRYLCVYLLDVSGHGVRAALTSVAAARSLIPQDDRASFVVTHEEGERVPVSPAVVADRLSRLFPIEENGGHFMTMAYGVLDTTNMTFTHVAAGHHGPLVIRKDHVEQIPFTPGFPIGIVDETDYVVQHCQLHPGDRLLIFSDGLIEQATADRNMFGTDNLVQLLDDSRSLGLDELPTHVFDRIQAWAGVESMDDDFSILAIQCDPAPMDEGPSS